MAASKQSRNITVVGATGTVGSHILASLVALGVHTVSVITRPGSQADFPSTVQVHRGSYDDESFLESSLKGQDVLILALHYNALEAQKPFIRAAAKAGTPYIVPTEYGSDTANKALNAEIELMNVKKPYRALIEELGVSAWIGVTTNPWFDFCMRGSFFDIDLKERTAKLLDGGLVKANFSTLDRVGKSLAALLSLPEAELAEHKNDWVYFSSFLASQRDILESALRATGSKEEDWTITGHSSVDVIKYCHEEAAKGNHMASAMSLFSFMFTEGFGGNFNGKLVDYEQLGLEKEESLDEAVKNLVEELGA